MTGVLDLLLLELVGAEDLEPGVAIVGGEPPRRALEHLEHLLDRDALLKTHDVSRSPATQQTYMLMIVCENDRKEMKLGTDEVDVLLLQVFERRHWSPPVDLALPSSWLGFAVRDG
jgi:hypothetical protein